MPLNNIFVSVYFISFYFNFQGGFARCYELLDLNSNKIYAGKIIAKTRIAKPHQRQKVGINKLQY